MFFSVRGLILRAENAFERGLYFMPVCYWFTLAINVFFVVYKGSGGGFIDLSVIPLWGVALLSVGIGYLAGFLVFLALPILRKKAVAKSELISLLKKSPEEEEEEQQEKKEQENENSEKKETKEENEQDDEVIAPKYEVETFDIKTEQLFTFLQILTAC